MDWSARRDVEAGVLNRRFQPGTVDPGRVEVDRDHSRVQVRPGRTDAWPVHKSPLHACDAAIALHAFDLDLQVFHPQVPLESDGFQRRNLSELATTLTLLNAIAAAAIVGLKNPSAASGIQTTL